jgi:hypothetical protein
MRYLKCTISACWITCYRTGFSRSVSGQTIQVCICYCGKITLAIKLVLQDVHNGNDGCGNQNTEVAKSLL